MTFLTAEHFERLMAPFLPYFKADTLAVAVSGGADSMALTLLLHDWCKKRGLRLVALTVDHGLRKESREEAFWVGAALQQLGIQHEILSWYHAQPLTSRLQERARVARYALMREWCEMNGVKALFTAHHQDDQNETRLIRLLRGSTLQGLAGIPRIRQDQGVLIMRPLLGVPKESLRSYLKQANVSWVEDPSNGNVRYQRVKVRRFARHSSLRWLEEAGPLLTSLRHHTDKVLAHLLEELLVDVGLEFTLSGVLCLDFERFKKLPVSWRAMLTERALLMVLNAPYGPRQESLTRLVAHLEAKTPKPSTLGGCLLLVKKECLWILREHIAPQPISFLESECLTTSFANEKTLFWLSALGSKGVQFLKRKTTLLEKTKIPHAVLVRLPAVLQQEGAMSHERRLLCVPALGYSGEFSGNAPCLSLAQGRFSHARNLFVIEDAEVT